MSHESRRAMSEAFSQFHLWGRRIRAHQVRWKAQAAQLIHALDKLEDAKVATRSRLPMFDQWTVERQRDEIGHVVWDEGMAAYDKCDKSHETLQYMIKARHECLTNALYLMGKYHGQLMKARSVSPSDRQAFAKAYWHHARQMAKTLRSHLPTNKVVGPDPEFSSTKGWANALGMRSAKDLIEAVFGSKNPGDLARNAGNG